ncbi:MAG: HIT-like protein [Actinobacteria bacterium ADurb.Bin346]|nr:MAG: HIT-like protein [Actinobacteria bacterium ADurb.Bin346]
MDDCLFCKIISGDIKSDKIFENEFVLVFRDINPKAPVHLLVVPKKHIASIMEIEKLGHGEIAEIMGSISRIAKELGLDKDGFRVVTNTGQGAGQSVAHLHFHVLGKRTFHWPPG